MTHGRKPCKPRQVRKDTMNMVLRRATRLLPHEVATVMEPLRQCYAHVRTATANEHQHQHQVLHTSLRIALEIEHQGVVRGLAEHLQAALAASQACYDRGMALGRWQASACHFHELDAMATAIDLHEYQLQHLSAAELQEATRRLIARAKSAGDEVLQVDTDLVSAEPEFSKEK